MAPIAVVPTMGLARGLKDLAGAAAVFAIPSLLMDLESILLACVGQVLHPAPDVHRTRGGELPEVNVAIRVSGRIVRVVLKFAVGATRVAVSVMFAPRIGIAEILIVHRDFFDGLVTSENRLGPVLREHGHVRLYRTVRLNWIIKAFSWGCWPIG